MSKRNNLEMKVILLILSNLERIPTRQRRLAVLDYIRGNLEFFTEEQVQTAQQPVGERQLPLPLPQAAVDAARDATKNPNGATPDYPGEFGG